MEKSPLLIGKSSISFYFYGSWLPWLCNKSPEGPQRWFPCDGSPCFDWRRAWRAFPARRSLVDLSGSAWRKVKAAVFFCWAGEVFLDITVFKCIQYFKHVTSGNWKMFKDVKTGSFLNITSQIKSLKYACNSCCSQKCSGDIDLFTWSVLVSRTKRTWVWRSWPRRL